MQMKKCDCVLCRFENPKPTATAVIIKDQELLVAKRNLKDQVFYGKWDLLGGYLNKNDKSPENALKREIKEELGVDCELTYLGTFTGSASYDNFIYPVISFAYLTELKGKIKIIDQNEISKLSWMPIKKY